ncbi:MAG: Cna B-type domain-containing protein [Eubacteriales bacterium]|nr:Cna B-type domain-containing protein [Eubacteriales bacterium]
MKRVCKQVLVYLLVLLVLIGSGLAPGGKAQAAVEKDGTRIEINDLAINPNPVNEGALASLKFQLKLTTLSENVLEAGDTVELTTNIGTLFGNLPAENIALFDENGRKVAMVKITEDKISVTMDDGFTTQENFLEMNLDTGRRLKALAHGATDTTPVVKQLTIEDVSTDVTFQRPTPAGGTVTESPDARVINNAFIEKAAWVSGYDTAHVALNVNQIGSLKMFNTYNYIANWIGNYREQTNMMVVDQIPEDGQIDEATVQLIAVRYNYVSVPAAGNQYYPAAVPGTILPIETHSQWHQIAAYMNYVVQSPTDTFDSFYAKVKAQKLSYGIYRDAATQGDTFVANFSNDSLKYTDLEPWLGNTEKIKDIYGENGPSHGNVISFRVEFDTHYPKLTGVKTMTNTAKVSSDQVPDGNTSSATYELDKGNGAVQVKAGTLKVRVVNASAGNTVVAGAKVKVQTLKNGTWRDYYIKNRLVAGTTNADGEFFVRGLSIGDYRVVQTETTENLVFTNKIFKENAADAGNANTVDESEGTFAITAGDVLGFSTVLPNFEAPTAVINGEKQLVDDLGAELPIEADQFTFKLALNPDVKSTGVEMPADLSAAVRADKTFAFDAVKFTELGDYQFFVTEDNLNVTGYTYDNSSWIVNVTVKIKDDRTDLETIVSYQKEDRAEQAIRFKNVFTPAPVLINVTGRKTWEDHADQDGIRPDSITVRLYANGQDTGKTKEVTAADQWTYTFEGVEQETNHVPNVYTVREETQVPGYTTTYDGMNITNTHVPEVRTIQVEKKWVDDDNANGTRPEQITVHVLNENGEVASGILQADAAGEWKTAFPNLPVHANGQKIVYRVEEEAVASYSNTISGDADSGFTITNTVEGKVSVGVTKKWAGKALDQVTIRLLADGNEVAAAKLTADTQWKHVFENLDQYRDGKTIEYTVKEDLIEGYQSTVSGDMTAGFVLTNTQYLQPVTIDLPLKKVVEGKPDQAGTFSFVLKGKEASFPMPEASKDGQAEVSLNDAGEAKFGHLTFKEVGVYAYTVSEVKGKDKHYTYDSAVYTVTFTVVDDNRQLKVTKTVIEKDGKPAQAVVFTNRYQKPTPSPDPTPDRQKTSSPKTGDGTAIGLYIGVAILSLGGLACVLTYKKRDNR